MSLLTSSITDLDTIFDADEFAQDATLQRTGYAPAAVRVIMNAEYAAIYAGGAEVSDSEAQCLIRTADAVDIGQGDSLMVDAVEYAVIELRPADFGLTLVVLSEDEAHG